MTSPNKTPKTLHYILWIAQALLSLLFVVGGLYKLVTPIVTLAQMWPWAGENPNLLRLTSLLDICGGAGLILPALIRTKPGLTRWAALGCVLLMVGAILFHFSRGEGATTPFNFFLLILALFVLWGRWMKVPLS